MSPLIASLLSIAAGIVLWQFLLLIARQLQRREHRLVAAVLDVLARAAVWYGVAGAVIAVLSVVNEDVLSAAARQRIVIIGLVVLTAVLIARLLRELLRAGLSRDRAAPMAASLMQSITYVAVYVIAGIVVLDVLGINVAGMVAAVGAGGIIIGLALQETLANFFAGLYILLAGKFKVGDYLVMDTLDGVVEDITWRTTILRRFTNAVLIVPNQRISSSALTVFKAEQSPVMVRLELLLAPNTDVERARSSILEALTERIARGADEGFAPEPAPAARFGESTRSGIPLSVWVAATSYQTMFTVRSEALCTCVSALARANIALYVPLQQQ